MPLVHLAYNLQKLTIDFARRLANELPAIIALNLSVEERERHDGNLLPEDIVVHCFPRVINLPEGIMSVNAKDLEIVIWAHDYPERRANLEVRKDQILARVRRFFADYDRDVSGSVWILLCPSAFGKI